MLKNFNISSIQNLTFSESRYDNEPDSRVFIDSLLFDTDLANNIDDSTTMKTEIFDSPKKTKMADRGIAKWGPGN